MRGPRGGAVLYRVFRSRGRIHVRTSAISRIIVIEGHEADARGRRVLAGLFSARRAIRVSSFGLSRDNMVGGESESGEVE